MGVRAAKCLVAPSLGLRKSATFPIRGLPKKKQYILGKDPALIIGIFFHFFFLFRIELQEIQSKQKTKKNETSISLKKHDSIPLYRLNEPYRKNTHTHTHTYPYRERGEKKRNRLAAETEVASKERDVGIK